MILVESIWILLPGCHLQLHIYICVRVLTETENLENEHGQ